MKGKSQYRGLKVQKRRGSDNEGEEPVQGTKGAEEEGV